METRKIVIAGGCGLAFGASFANTGLVLRVGTSVSHLTGDIARLSLDLAQLSPNLLADALQVGAAVTAFLLGAILAGVLVHHPVLDLSRPYGRLISGIGLLFLAAAAVLDRHPLAGIGLAALGCGVQNSLAAHYRGIVLRTTHLTGLITDLGVTLGMRLRGYDIPRWKIAVPLLLVLSFFAGGIAAGLVHFVGGGDTVAIAGVAYLVAGAGWTVWKRTRPGRRALSS